MLLQRTCGNTQCCEIRSADWSDARLFQRATNKQHHCYHDCAIRIMNNNNVVTNAMRICDHIVVFKIVDQRRRVAKEAVKINPSPVRVWLKQVAKQGAIQWLQVCNLVCCIHAFQAISICQISNNTCMLCTDISVTLSYFAHW